MKANFEEITSGKAYCATIKRKNDIIEDFDEMITGFGMQKKAVTEINKRESNHSTSPIKKTAYLNKN